MRYEELAEVFESLSQTSSRLKKTVILARFLRKIPVGELDEAALLLQGRVFAEWDPQRVGLAAKLVLKAIVRATGYSESHVQQEFKKSGDLGLTVYELTKHKKQQTLFSSPLNLHPVFVTLQKIASHEGLKSQDAKLGSLAKLLTSATPLEAKFLVRTVLEDLRVGIAQGTLRDALALAFYTTTFSYDDNSGSLEYNLKTQRWTLEQVKELIQRALDLTADFVFVLKHIKDAKPLDAIKLHAGTPCKCMLARKEPTFGDAFQRTGLPARLEYKYDGFRLQVHKKGSLIRLFTRRLEDVTRQFPDVVAAVKEHVKPHTVILDAEAVGYNAQTKVYEPFQHISQRIRRKYGISGLAKKLPVELNVFDILLYKDTILLDEPLTKRLSYLNKAITSQSRQLVGAQGVIVETEDEANAFYQQSLDAGNEGVMIKDLSGTYKPGGRVSAWIKMKPTMQELDLVVVGAQWGNGKRSRWLTSFTLACQSEDGDILEVGKVGTGMKEEADDEDVVSFAQLTQLLEPLIIGQKGKEVSTKPEVVLELAYEEIQKSPTYSSGYALRFPRVLRLRSDRAIDDIATKEDIEELYYAQ